MIPSMMISSACSVGVSAQSPLTACVIQGRAQSSTPAGSPAINLESGLCSGGGRLHQVWKAAARILLPKSRDHRPPIALKSKI
jgi:hypothetical protein